jgi:archaellum component FlaC
MAESGSKVHDGTQAILRVIQADIAEVKQRLGGVENRLDGFDSRLNGLEQTQHATLELVESVAKSVTTISLTVESAVDKVLKSHQLMGSRLNIIEGRLAAIEEHTGMVRA